MHLLDDRLARVPGGSAGLGRLLLLAVIGALLWATACGHTGWPFESPREEVLATADSFFVRLDEGRLEAAYELVRAHDREMVSRDTFVETLSRERRAMRSHGGTRFPHERAGAPHVVSREDSVVYVGLPIRRPDYAAIAAAADEGHALDRAYRQRERAESVPWTVDRTRRIAVVEEQERPRVALGLPGLRETYRLGGAIRDSLRADLREAMDVELHALWFSLYPAETFGELTKINPTSHRVSAAQIAIAWNGEPLNEGLEFLYAMPPGSTRIAREHVITIPAAELSKRPYATIPADSHAHDPDRHFEMKGQVEARLAEIFLNEGQNHGAFREAARRRGYRPNRYFSTALRRVADRRPITPCLSCLADIVGR